MKLKGETNPALGGQGMENYLMHSKDEETEEKKSASPKLADDNSLKISKSEADTEVQNKEES